MAREPTPRSRMDDLEAIQQLKARYFRTMDTKDWAGMREVFADDVVMDTTSSGGRVITDADAFIAFLREILTGVVTVHHGHMPEIELTSPTTARGIWAMFDYVDFPAVEGRDRFAFQGYGHYTEEYVREDGTWRIERLELSRLRIDPQ